ncbi:MAG: Grx4 family monothiol glutaredoxin [Pseudomonadota bacterium]
MSLTPHAETVITGLLDTNRVVLFMKGTPQTPQCGFSASASGILSSLAPGYATFNVLEDAEVREGIKAFGQWPTIPQLYIDKELVGGSDIINQMFNSGELHEMLGLEKPDRSPPEITITDAAAAAIRAGTEEQPDIALHLKIDEYWRPQFMLQPATGDELVSEANGIAVHFDVMSAARARGMKVDYVESLQGSGLTIEMPEAPPEVQAMEPAEAAAALAGGGLRVIDVRPEHERAQAAVAGALALDRDSMAELMALPKDTPLAFLCHVGRSSLGVAEHFRKEGFRTLYNVTGGIDAWSQEVDETIPRY